MTGDSLVRERVYQIEKGVPIPQKQLDTKYPFRSMDIGDSFFTTGTPASYISLHTRLLRPKRFSCRTVIENGVKGLRIWRLE